MSSETVVNLNDNKSSAYDDTTLVEGLAMCHDRDKVRLRTYSRGQNCIIIPSNALNNPNAGHHSHCHHYCCYDRDNKRGNQNTALSVFVAIMRRCSCAAHCKAERLLYVLNP